MKISKYFTAQELLPKEIYTQFGAKSIWFLDQDAVSVLDLVREKLNTPLVVNDWLTGGQYNLSGYRLPDCPTGGKLSQHKSGRAFDIKSKKLSVTEMYTILMSHEQELLARGLTVIEDIPFTKTWLHFDTRWTGLDKILIVKP